MIYTIEHIAAEYDRETFKQGNWKYDCLGKRRFFPGSIVFETEEQAKHYLSLMELVHFNVKALNTTWENTYTYKDGTQRLLKDCDFNEHN